MGLSSVLILGLLLASPPVPGKVANSCTADPQAIGGGCSCNIDRPTQDCVNCVQSGQFFYCLDSIYGGSCNCSESGLGCAVSGVCCVWV
jgi:hypothetical protein